MTMTEAESNTIHYSQISKNKPSTSISLYNHKSIADLVYKHFHTVLPKKGKPALDNHEWTTLAAIVQSEGSDLRVVSLCTGTKCLGEKELSSLGDKISDSHAEVLARRAFLLYLYDQIIISVKDQSPSIFLKKLSTKDEDSLMTVVLRPGIAFHFFISQLPCGDACIFPNGNETCDEEDEGEPVEKKSKVEEQEEHERKLVKRKKRSNRTGAKLLVGGTYEEDQEEGKCRVKPGKGDPTLSMSCSDKLAKWQMFGLQGALLGNFIPTPIRFTSITIGSGGIFDETSLQRAIFTRYHNQLQQTLISWEEYVCPLVAQTETNIFLPRDQEVGRPSPGSIIWTLDETTRHDPKNVEVGINGYKQGVTKKLLGTPLSQLGISRQKLLHKFVCVAKLCRFNQLKENMKYCEVKALNLSYNEMWNRVKSQLMIGWTTKPPRLSHFLVKLE